MTQIVVSDEVATRLASLAASRGCEQTDLASALLQQAMSDQDEGELAPPVQALLLDRLRRSSAGNSISAEQVDAKFASFFASLERP